jgi:acyl carrier protein
MNEQIKQIVGKILKVDVDENLSQENCVEWDSLRHLTIIVELEMEFEVSFEPNEIARMKSIEEIQRVISEKHRP